VVAASETTKCQSGWHSAASAHLPLADLPPSCAD